MTSLIDALLRRRAAAPHKGPRPGEFYAFETEPVSEFGAPTTNRYAAFKLLGVSDELVVIAVLDGIWRSAPPLSEVQNRGLLRMQRFSSNGEVAVFGTDRAWWPSDELRNVQLLGRARVSSQEAKLARLVMACGPGSSFSTLGYANDVAEGEWRWVNDREAYVAEIEREEEKAKQARAAAERRYRERLKTLTFEQLLSEVPLPKWTESPPYPAAEFTVAARSKLLDAARALEQLGSKPRKAAVRKVLKDTIEWFNRADREADGPIETEEREDLFAALEELAFAAGQPKLAEEIHEWREW